MLYSRMSSLNGRSSSTPGYPITGQPPFGGNPFGVGGNGVGGQSLASHSAAGHSFNNRPVHLLSDPTSCNSGGHVPIIPNRPIRSVHNFFSEPHSIHAILQDAYDVTDDDDVNTQDANFYDASSASTSQHPSGDKSVASPDVRISMDPQERLIDAITQLKEVIVDNTSAQAKHKRHRGPGGSRGGGGSERQTTMGGLPLSATSKDDRLKVRKEKVIVELRVVFLKIGEIDTLKEQYSADTFIQAKWREPALDGKTVEELKRIDLEKFWNPLLYIDNILSETKEATWLTSTVSSRMETYILERRRIRGIFMENLELNDFPLDVQDLTVTMTSERPDTEIDIIPDENEMSGINVQTFVDQQEWKLHEHIEVSRKMMTQEYSSSNRCHPALSVTCRAARRPGYFYWNVFLVMFFISALSFATFAVSPVLPQNRLQLSFTLLLTCVTFKFVINQSLPKISYLTYMDKYVLLSLVILCAVCIWHAIVTVFSHYGTDFLAKLERDVFIIFVTIYILCHVVFIFWLYFDACKRRRLMTSKDKEYLEFLTKKKEWMEKVNNPNSRRQSTLLMHSVHVL